MKKKKKEEQKPTKRFLIHQWLAQHGGRNEIDLLKDGAGIYVEMGCGEFGKKVNVYLPRFDLSPPVDK
jgi:hypothetical protein